MDDRSAFSRRCQHLNIKIAEVTETVGAILLAAIVIINSIAVFYRFVLFNPVGWTEEALRYAIIWAVYLVGGATIVRGEQMSINLLSAIDNHIVRTGARLLTVVVTVSLAAVILVYGIPMLISNASQVSPTMRIPMSIPYSAVVVGYPLIALQSILHFLSGDDAIQKGA